MFRGINFYGTHHPLYVYCYVEIKITIILIEDNGYVIQTTTVYGNKIHEAHAVINACIKL